MAEKRRLEKDLEDLVMAIKNGIDTRLVKGLSNVFRPALMS